MGLMISRIGEALIEKPVGLQYFSPGQSATRGARRPGSLCPNNIQPLISRLAGRAIARF